MLVDTIENKTLLKLCPDYFPESSNSEWGSFALILLLRLFSYFVLSLYHVWAKNHSASDWQRGSISFTVCVLTSQLFTTGASVLQKSIQLAYSRMPLWYSSQLPQPDSLAPVPCYRRSLRTALPNRSRGLALLLVTFGSV